MMAIKAMAILCGALAALYALHRLCDWAESRGWIHYRKTRASGNALGASALQLQDLFESGKASHVLEAQDRGSAAARWKRHRGTLASHSRNAAQLLYRHSAGAG
jgi:hypothetical protein